jgi:hypothetical protein
MPGGVAASVGFSGVDRVNFPREKVDVHGWDREVVLMKNHSLRDAFAEVSDVRPGVFHESYRLPAAGDHDDEGCAFSEMQHHLRNFGTSRRFTLAAGPG